MSSFYVLGHDENGKLIAMTSRAFPSEQAARDYAATCAAGWTPFVVERKPCPQRKAETSTATLCTDWAAPAPVKQDETQP